MLPDTALLFPAFVLILTTFLTALALGISRFVSVRRGDVEGRYYRLFEGPNSALYERKFARHFSNLLEMPVLFYVLVVLLMLFRIEHQSLMLLAWIFVILRLIHTIIHISYNHPIHRFLLFFCSNIVLLAMWFYFIYRIVLLSY